jgi:hypothetical protein
MGEQRSPETRSGAAKQRHGDLKVAATLVWPESN